MHLRVLRFVIFALLLVTCIPVSRLALVRAVGHLLTSTAALQLDTKHLTGEAPAPSIVSVSISQKTCAAQKTKKRSLERSAHGADLKRCTCSALSQVSSHAGQFRSCLQAPACPCQLHLTSELRPRRASKSCRASGRLVHCPSSKPSRWLHEPA